MISQGGKLRCGNEPEPSFMIEKRQGFIKGGNKFVTLSTLEVHRREKLNKILNITKRKNNGDHGQKEPNTNTG